MTFEMSSVSKVVQELLKEDSFDKAIYIYNLDLLKQRLTHLSEVYPNNVHHAVAVKTNNLPKVLETIVAMGCGLEAASLEEVELAKLAGCKSEDIVFDSPVKTVNEIEYCDAHFQGIRINANSFYELDKLRDTKNIRIGIRINPMLKIDSPGIFNVSGSKSKFGIPIGLESKVVEYIKENCNVEGLHVHPGSEIQSLDDHIECLGLVYDMAERINAILPNRITSIDIGGGIKPRIESGKQVGLDDFVNALTIRCPNVFTNYNVITEYGRYIHTECAVVVSRVEDVLSYTEPTTILVHVGADLFLREVYNGSPKHNFVVLNNEGIVKNESLELVDIGGPLCFSGDYLARGYNMPKVEIGDCIVMDTCGSNSISMWSSHCSRIKPRIVYVD